MFGRNKKDKEIELLKLQLKNWKDYYMQQTKEIISMQNRLALLNKKLFLIKDHLQQVKDMQFGYSGRNWQREIRDMQETIKNIRTALQY